jgi:hypothetical protein
MAPGRVLGVFKSVLAGLGIALAACALLVGLFAALIMWELTPVTEYASGFSERAFAQIETGMSVEEVKALLGDPFQLEDPHCELHGRPCPLAETEVLYYSRGRWRTCPFRKRAVILCNGVVQDRASFVCP